MWSREQLKNKAKQALNANYWKAVIVALIVVLIGASGGADYSANYEVDLEDSLNSLFQGNFDSVPGIDDEFYDDSFTYEDDFIIDDFNDYFEAEIDSSAMIGLAAFLVIFFIIFAVIMAIAVVISLVLTAFVLNPIEVGTSRFFFKALNEKAEVKEVAFAFDNSYKNVAKIMFFRTLYTMLWSLLFVIPGIIKGYEYRMIPYLLAENPNLTKEQAFALSKQMMNGQKWEAFVLDLSFIGWDLLSALTLGILSIFYVEPYRNLTFAALYEELSLVHGRPAFSQQASRVGEFHEYTMDRTIDIPINNDNQ